MGLFGKGKKKKEKDKQTETNEQSRPKIQMDSLPPMPPQDELNDMFSNLLTELGVPDSKRKQMEALANERKWLLLFQHKSKEEEKKFKKSTGKEEENAPKTFIDRVTQELSLETVSQLRTALSSNPISWITEFVNHNGLTVLFQKLEEVTKSSIKTDQDWNVQHELIKCLKALMNNQIGLEAVLSEQHNIFKIAMSLNSSKWGLLTTVVELLAAVCLVPPNGHKYVLESLSFVREYAKQKSRFSILMSHLQRSTKDKSSLDFKVSVMMFINTLVNSPDDIFFRIELRKEFAILGIRRMIEKLKSNKFPELQTQIEMFLEEWKSDEQETGEEIHDIPQRNENDPDEVFNYLKDNIIHTEYEKHFMSLLNSLCDASYDTSLDIWSTIDALTTRTIELAANREEDAQSLLFLIQGQGESDRIKELETYVLRQKEELEELDKNISAVVKAATLKMNELTTIINQQRDRIKTLEGMKSSTVVDDEQVLGLQVQVESLIKERNELEKRVNELENKMGFNDDEGTKVIIVELNERIIGLNAQIEEQRQTITSLTEDIETYQQTILLLQEEYENAQEQLREHLEEDDEVEKKPQRDSKNIRELKEQLDKANRELEETKQELKATQELLDEEITQPKGKVTDGDTMGDSDKDEEIFLLKQQIEQLSNDCAAFQRVLSNTRTKYEEQIDELTEQLQLYQKGDEKVSSIWQKRYQLLDNEKNEEIRKMEENMVLLKEEYSSEIKELNSLVANLQNDSDNYQRTISIVKETYQNQISELTQRLESKAQITSEYRELKSVEAEKETLEKMLSDSKEKYQEEKLINDQTVSNLRQIVRDMEDDAKNQQQALDLLHERVQELEDDATAYQRALMSMKLGYEEQLQQAQEELESLRENAQMSDQKDSSQIAVKSDSKEELANLRRQNNMLISKTKDMEAYERMMSSLRKEVEDLKKESQKHAARADEFTEKYAKVKEERAKSEEIYQKDITKLKAQLSSLQLSNEERTETTGPQNGARQPDTKRFINLENKVRMLSTELANERSLAKLTQNTLQKRYESQVEVLRSKLQTAEAQMQEISQEMLRERREMEEQMRKMMESSRMLSGKKQDRRENLREIQKGTPVKQGELSDEMGAQEISLMRQGYEQRIKSLNTQLATYMDLEKKHKEEIEELRRSYEAKISAISRYVTPTETPSLETPQDDSDSTQTPLKTSGKYSRPLPRGRRTGGGFTAQRRQFEDTIRKLETEVAALKRKLAEAKPETEDSQQALALELFSGVGNTQFVPRVFEKRKEAKPNPDPSVPMKNLNWSRISNARVEKTIWNNLSDQEVQINKSALEAAFRSTSSGETTSTKSGQTTTSAQTSRSKSKSQTVTILSPKRSEAIALMLSGLQISFLGIKEAVLSLDDAALTTDQLILLRQNAPKVSEIEALEEFQHLSPTRFGKAEQFFLQIRHIPRFSARIQAWICERTFADKIQNICSLADDVIAACKEIQESEKFSAVLSTILAVGNYMNGGTHKGGAYGFRVSTLVKLNQIRGTGSFPTLLHFVVNLVKTNQPQNVSFSEQIPHISGAAKASGKFISTEVNEMTKDLKIVGLEIENCAGESTGEVFKTRMLKFFANASKQHREMVEKVKLMEDTFNSTAVFFGEEIENSDPAKFFTAINIFISAFDRIAAGKSQEVKPRSQTKFFKKQGNVGVVDGLINSLKSGRISKQWN